jgi:hypothetical protein
MKDFDANVLVRLEQRLIFIIFVYKRFNQYTVYIITSDRDSLEYFIDTCHGDSRYASIIRFNNNNNNNTAVFIVLIVTTLVFCGCILTTSIVISLLALFSALFTNVFSTTLWNLRLEGDK